jgi:ubiquinone/menaquinone biosynthesis C-methylase UbiE
MEQQLSILRDLGVKLNSNSVIVDLGCGNGSLVTEYLKYGFNAYGCDFKFKVVNVRNLFESGRIKIIDQVSYRLPFEDKSVDLILSDQVFEHVEDYSTTLSEMRRVLKPSGVCLNFFPSRYRIIESHVFIPFASINKSYSWLLFWALLGIGTRKGKTPKETAQLNYEYLTNQTFYLTKSEIVKHCKKHFDTVKFSEELFIKYFPSTFISRLSKIPLISLLYSTMRQRVMFLR